MIYSRPSLFQMAPVCDLCPNIFPKSINKRSFSLPNIHLSVEKMDRYSQCNLLDDKSDMALFRYDQREELLPAFIPSEKNSVKAEFNLYRRCPPQKSYFPYPALNSNKNTSPQVQEQILPDNFTNLYVDPSYCKLNYSFSRKTNLRDIIHCIYPCF